MDWGDRLNMFPNHRLWAGCLIALSLLLSSGLAHGDDALTILKEDYPPLNYVENKELKGPSVDIVRAIQEKLGRADKIADKISVYPWARAYRFLETRKNTALFSTARTSSRENQFKWVGPIAEKKIGMYAKRVNIEELELVLEIENTFIYIAFNSATPDSIVAAWQEAYDGLVQEGAVKRYFRRINCKDSIRILAKNNAIAT